MKNIRYLVYDIEIFKAIPPKVYSEWIEGIAYCNGWDDKANMGISVICAAANDMQSSVFCWREDQDNLKRFQWEVERHDLLVGFNSESFDDQVLASHGIEVHTGYDILREFYRAKGLNPYPEKFDSRYAGCGLNAIAQANGLGAKTGDGALAPVWWQQGEKDRVVEYCIQDVKLTQAIFEKILNDEPLNDPVSGRQVMLKKPKI